MKKEHDFSKGKREPVIPLPAGKLRITIRLDQDVLEWFKARVDHAGGGNYQTMMNDALRQFMASERQPLEASLRRVVREELAAYGKGRSTKRR
jgi:uncharacterized protein (DUF4415 family)